MIQRFVQVVLQDIKLDTRKNGQVVMTAGDGGIGDVQVLKEDQVQNDTGRALHANKNYYIHVS